MQEIGDISLSTYFRVVDAKGEPREHTGQIIITRELIATNQDEHIKLIATLFIESILRTYRKEKEV